jgi:hypothetical protein
VRLTAPTVDLVLGRRAASVAAVALVLGAGGAGYIAGLSGGEDLDEAEAAGATAGREVGSLRGQRRGHADGIAQGRWAGLRETYRRAYRAAYRRALAAVEQGASASASAPGQPGSCPPGQVSAANGCVPEQQAVCAAYQDFVPGQGCVPPLEPGQVEATPNCPPGQVPVGVTGACARP